jgi:hypothetical protein
MAESRRNRLIADLPDDEQEALDSLLEDVMLVSHEVIAESGSPLNWVHFPESSMISLVTVVNGDGGIEALTVGVEGTTALPLITGSRTTFARVVVQIPGLSTRAKSADFDAALPRLPELKRRLSLYSQLAFDTTAQCAACNRMHVTEERTARWLLMSEDRAHRDEFELTQHFLSQMLGVRRPAVTVAVGMLERQGLIAHRRGRIRIVDREGLERAACECYSLIRRREKELLGPTAVLEP